MTCDERLEQLLNRCGQTISDLPKASKYDFAYSVNCENETKDHRSNSVRKAVQEFQFGYEFEKGDDRKYIDYILHLTDIIDRMETALENVCGERDYLVQRVIELGGMDCEDCVFCGTVDDCHLCIGYEVTTEKETFGAWAGVPEDWSVDNG